MKKLIIATSIISASVLLPVLGMAINPTREILLGLAPDEQVLKLADKIDTDREEIKSELDKKEQTILELQLALDEQQSEIDNQQEVTAEKVCNYDVETECKDKRLMNKNIFNEYLNEMKGDMSDYSDKEWNKIKNEMTEKYNNCQSALKCKSN